ncbi:Predicted cell-wall-anchored protein SasA (LPXTG motif) [Caballeronia glathei]|uniref:hypothetical protein n=1 Tax=Caballeronia glathei TaxID=60547 RepID=UPI000500BAFD|nr:hypothetical protein [Caballeronia glathei]CDY79497.1 Predicted cell-wall-anchored protein SasA (LPXTG motif) [Caballeronia glathei]
MGSLSGSTTILAGTETFNLSSPAQTDWIEFHASTTPNRMSGAGSTIGLPTLLGSGVSWGTFAFGLGYTWTGGTPQASGTAVKEGIFVSATTATAGQGFKFTLPADTTSRTVTIYWGGNSCASQIDISLSDGSAAPVQHLPAAPGSGASQFLATTLTYSADSAGKQLICQLTAKSIIGGGGNVWMGAAKYLNATATSTGAGASIQGGNTGSAIGAVSISRSAAQGQAKNSGATSGAVVVSGSGAGTQTANAVSSVARSAISGTSASTQASNTAAASGSVGISGAAASTQAPNASTASGAIGNVSQGSAASTQAKNVSAAAGGVLVSGSGASVQSENVVAASGSVVYSVISGAGLSTQAKTLSLAIGAVSVSGSAASMQAPNSDSSTGVVVVSGSLASVTQRPSLSAAIGQVTATSYAADQNYLVTVAPRPFCSIASVRPFYSAELARYFYVKCA